MNGEVDYSVVKGLWKSIKDGVMLAVAASAAVIGANAVGLVEQCPEATVTIFGATIGLKAAMQFLNNYRKNV